MTLIFFWLKINEKCCKFLIIEIKIFENKILCLIFLDINILYIF